MTLLMVPQSVCISEGPFTSGPRAFIRLFTSMFHHFMKTKAVGSREGPLTLQTPVLGAIISTLKQKNAIYLKLKNTFEEMCLFIKNCLFINIERVTRLLSNTNQPLHRPTAKTGSRLIGQSRLISFMHAKVQNRL